VGQELVEARVQPVGVDLLRRWPPHTASRVTHRWPAHSSHGTAQAARYGHDLSEKAIFAFKTTPRNDDENW
jgi:hypothetical protein